MDGNHLTIGPSRLATVIDYSIRNKENLLIIGPPGVGKSDSISQGYDRAVRSLAEDRRSKAKILFIHAVTSEPTDAKGMGWVKVRPDQTLEAVWIPFGDLKAMIEADELRGIT